MEEKLSENLRTIRRPLLERKYEELLTASAIKQQRRQSITYSEIKSQHITQERQGEFRLPVVLENREINAEDSNLMPAGESELFERADRAQIELGQGED